MKHSQIFFIAKYDIVHTHLILNRFEYDTPEIVFQFMANELHHRLRRDVTGLPFTYRLRYEFGYFE
ncbi:hypothetical protein BKK80_34495 (plasmid) [Cupriavidus malaysiensis]|uniref:Uncharacterized protein n=1 Tax=Cupriavidus malaysiensis TaxID=367825 RepID=A0ABN4TVP6_9BURK|nr:hypothetical protein BKK80_34495 [Cupriavidus malaysiensis]